MLVLEVNDRLRYLSQRNRFFKVKPQFYCGLAVERLHKMIEWEDDEILWQRLENGEGWV